MLIVIFNIELADIKDLVDLIDDRGLRLFEFNMIMHLKKLWSTKMDGVV